MDIDELIPIAVYAEKIGRATISVADKCRRGSLPGARKIGRDWFVPRDAVYPDMRIKTGNNIGKHKKK